MINEIGGGGVFTSTNLENSTYGGLTR